MTRPATRRPPEVAPSYSRSPRVCCWQWESKCPVALGVHVGQRQHLTLDRAELTHTETAQNQLRPERTWLDPGVAAIDSRGGSSARTAVRLEYATIGWNVLEAAVAVGSGIVAGSLALVAFGLGSAIEVVSATVVLVHLRAVLVLTLI